ncbi:uncharacterized protein isoform X2 [Musca autumnalis]|uniref:uncharacterized protein isoform X2 n=1 Tax=Musca autumnalis TaxID=221902 RepID=UPI003CEA3E7A
MDRVTKPQKKMLITLLRETKYMEGKKEKEWYWEKIQEALNKIGPKKTIIQWKKCWRDMRLTTRKKLAELKRCQMAGGSPPPGIELSQEDNDIIDIVGTEYFYEEMNGELKPENFITGFDYVPEHFCDAILTAAAVSSGQQHMQHQKEQQQQQQQHAQQQDHHTNDGETNDAPGSSNHADTQAGPFGQGNVAQMTGHNGDHSNSTGTLQQHNIMPNHPAFSGGLHPHLMRRQQHASAAFHREAAFEEKLLQFMQDAFPKKSKKRKSRDPDKLFLLSLYEEIKRVPEDIRLDVKSELIQVLKRYQKKSPIKQEKTHHTHTQSSSSSGKSSGSTTPNEKVQLPQQHTQLSHSMYQLQKKYDKTEKEPSPQSQVDRVQQHSREQVAAAAAAAAAAAVATSSVASLHAPQQIPHSLFQLQKKYEESAAEKVHQQNEQRKHVEAAHQQHQSAHQQPPPPPPSNEQQQQQQQHLHHPQMTHGIMFPLPQIRSEQPGGGQQQQHHAHNPHQQPQQSQHHQQQSQHHPPSIFGNPATTAGGMSTDRPAMSYENVG